MSNPLSQTIGDVAAQAGFPFDHVALVHPPGHHNGDYYATHCMFCDGGLFACTVCGSFEGATTTQCPGRQLTAQESDDVYANKLDYRGGRWVAQSSYYAPGGYWNYYAQITTE
ncbi:hypothetical protein PBI_MALAGASYROSE_60 [Mycobacterium phage MalagasyRose]|uniref:Uncharacterized protein n=1 Tax=Mycobacterium phage MalagasyRose TaxID=2599870 RepID=A0A5J6TEQ7_9CAUD|nr:hypothetical protein QEH39_gp28 [Mycobacterium phage MalagasyRose]QFG08908.1 hypothetical protein PBI_MALAGASYROSE_60 [Mycobacterium phage MalagasyRose]